MYLFPPDNYAIVFNERKQPTMNNIILTQFSVKGIKNLEDEVSLSFYRKTLSGRPDTRGYNVKAIYGENGAGKTGLISSINILKNLIVDPGYLRDSFVQNKLEKLVNKKLGTLGFDVSFLTDTEKGKKLYRYRIAIKKGFRGGFEIEREQLSFKKASSHNENMSDVFSVINGEIDILNVNKKIDVPLREMTKNLLGYGTMASLYVQDAEIRSREEQKDESMICIDLVLLYLFGHSIYVYLDDGDDHTDYFISNLMDKVTEESDSAVWGIMKDILRREHNVENASITPLFPETMRIPIKRFPELMAQIKELEKFIRIFKNQLRDIEVSCRIDGDIYRCDLIMKYDDYSVDAEFESTGIKKLIKLFSYIRKMAEGEIVFIDELDSNLHDVYLCALLEYLMEYGKGQLCFTTHNIGPMDVLKKNKKSIDFLSINQQIYSWTTNGNYSPSKLYREGMITGSPFNVDSIDFISVFGDPRGE